MLQTLKKVFKENVRYVLRENAPDDIINRVRKYYDIPDGVERFSFVVSKSQPVYVLDNNGLPIVRCDSRLYFKADRENKIDAFAIETADVKPRFENVWYELRSDAVKHFPFTRDMIYSLGVVGSSVFRFTPDRVDVDGNAIVGSQTIPAHMVPMFNRELKIEVGKCYRIRDDHIGVAWRLLPQRAQTLLFEDRWYNMSRTIQCTSIEPVVELDNNLALIDNGVATLTIDNAKFMLYEV